MPSPLRAVAGRAGQDARVHRVRGALVRLRPDAGQRRGERQGGRESDGNADSHRCDLPQTADGLLPPLGTLTNQLAGYDSFAAR